MKLSDLQLSSVHSQQHRAVMRLILRVYAETHRIFRRTFEVSSKAIILSAEDTDGFVDATALTSRVPSILNQFQRDVQEWGRMFEAARVQAANIALGGLVVSHNAYFGAALTESVLSEQVTPEALVTAVTQAQAQGLSAGQVANITRLWTTRRDRALAAASQRVQSDGLVLSSRIWNLENSGLQQIRNTLLAAFSERTSAARLAGLLESALGAGRECPRWAFSRLYGMDARERAQDSAGLLRDDECRATGISYNALRLARTELQYAHNYMAMDIYQNAPWVSGYKVQLSPTHPKVDICDELAAGGPYEPGDLRIPAHPNCVTPGQFVQTAKGSVPIEQVQAGDYVLTHKGRYRAVRSAWSRQCDEAVYLVEMDSGQFELTGEHPVLTVDRGWVEAKSLQVGEQILYTDIDITLDLFTGIPENSPTAIIEPSITPDVMIGLKRVPSITVALNSDTNGRECKVKEESSDAPFSLKSNSGANKCVSHGNFNACGVLYPEIALCFEHGDEAGIIFSFRPGDLSSNFWPLSGVLVTGQVKTLHSFLHFLTGQLAASSVVLFPTSCNSIPHTTHGYTTLGQEGAQRAKINMVALENLSARKSLIYVDIFQQILDWASVFGLKAKFVPLSSRQAVGTAMSVVGASELHAANGASQHDNLLSLSPDDRVGHESGNSFVSELARPTQALMNYSTIRRIKQRRYQGLVYNMEVEEDNSYTVNGAVVHNCLCVAVPVLMPADRFRNQVRGWLADENEFLDNYRNWLGVPDPLVQLPWTLSLADSLELWLNTSAGGQAAAIGVD